METLYLILIGIFIPLFPMSMLFNTLFAATDNAYLRITLLVAWPVTGIVLLKQFATEIPDWIVYWALFTAVLYAVRLLTIRELGLWAGFIATSAWSILWVSISAGASEASFYPYVLSYSLPLILLVLLCKQLSNRFGAAYVGLFGGLAETQPRFAGVFTMVLLACIATPLFPAFITSLQVMITAMPTSFGFACVIGIVWLLWCWAGARVIHGTIVGAPKHQYVDDIGSGQSWLYVGALVGLIAMSFYLVGELL